MERVFKQSSISTSSELGLHSCCMNLCRQPITVYLLQCISPVLADFVAEVSCERSEAA